MGVVAAVGYQSDWFDVVRAVHGERARRRLARGGGSRSHRLSRRRAQAGLRRACARAHRLPGSDGGGRARVAGDGGPPRLLHRRCACDRSPGQGRLRARGGDRHGARLRDGARGPLRLTREPECEHRDEHPLWEPARCVRCPDPHVRVFHARARCRARRRRTAARVRLDRPAGGRGKRRARARSGSSSWSCSRWW